MLNLKLKGSYTVKPAKQTPSGCMSLSDCDQSAALTHAPTVYFYRAANESLQSAVNTLRDSLSKALVIFYPLAGRLNSIEGGRHELYCNAMGAQLLEAESEAKIDDFGDFCPSPEIRALIPSIDYTNTPFSEQPLLLAQLTKFSCGGISLGLAVSHIMVDGLSALHFVSEWAKIARGLHSNNPPFLDRTILQVDQNVAPPRFDHPEFSPPPLLIGSADSMEERKKESIVAILKLSSEQIEKLKNKANEDPTFFNNNGRAYSRYEAVAGHLWRCASKARGHKSQQLTRLRVVVNIRNRMQPPLPQGYFGNALFRAMATTNSEDLLSKPLAYASSKIREAVDKVTDEYIRSGFAYAKSLTDVSQFRTSHTLGCTQSGFLGNPNFDVTSWVNLPVYGTDFGWGNEIYMGPGAIGHDGKCFLIPGHDEDGSFIAVLRLQVEHMEAFKKFFYQDAYLDHIF